MPRWRVGLQWSADKTVPCHYHEVGSFCIGIIFLAAKGSRPMNIRFIGVLAFSFAVLALSVRADEPAKETASSTQASSAGTEQNKTMDSAQEGEKGSPDATSPTPNPTVDPAAELLQRLKPENLKNLADTIAQDWPDRPEWAEMALAVMRGQAMEPGMGWWRTSEKKYGWTWLKRKYDANSDNSIAGDEFPADLPNRDVLFQRIDRDLDGKLTAADFDVSVFQGTNFAAMKGRVTEFLFRHLDADSNGQVTMDELGDFFRKADREQSAFLTAEDILTALDDGESQRGSADSDDGPSTSEQLKMFFTGQFGWFAEGPKLGEQAPDFTLRKHDEGGTLRLADLREKKPVVLIFGSFT